MLKLVGLAGLAAVAAFGAWSPRPAPVPRMAVAKAAAPAYLGRLCKSDDSAATPNYPVWVGQSFAQDNCVAPVMPRPVDGLTASREQIVADIAATKRYAVMSERFQQCVSDFVAARKAQAIRDNKPVQPSLLIIESHRVLASQNNSRKVVAQSRAAINAFNEYGSGCTG